MTLAPGHRLGPYEIVAPLGAGGMGEVYRARDTRLDREVAIKVLPATVVVRPEARERFLREARAASALNHPHICAIYDVSLGDAGDTPFLAMELLEGETLQQRLRIGPLPVPTVIETGAALADALDAAHAKGIVHRDIKPANIVLTARGPKILDFGLAKISPTAVGGAAETMTMAGDGLTSPGTTMGTVAYMSPEQVRGEELDARTDLFSLGVVLYEMATGTRPFGGVTSGAISAAILHTSPAPPAALRPDVPPRLEDIILKALEKDREFRTHSAGDLRSDLKRLQRDPAASGFTAAAGPHRPSTLLRRPMLWLALIVLGCASLGLYMWAHRWNAADGAAPVARDLDVTTVAGSGDAEAPAISPDGKYIAYVRRNPLTRGAAVWVTQLAAGVDAELVPATPGVNIRTTSVTPDGSFVDFVRATGADPPSLWRVPIIGGTPRVVIDGVNSRPAFSRDGAYLAFIRSDAEVSSLVVANVDGSAARILVSRHPPNAFVTLRSNTQYNAAPGWSPDGRRIAVLAVNTPPVISIVVIDVATGRERLLTVREMLPQGGPCWLDDESVLVSGPARALDMGGIQPTQLWRVTLTDGAARRITNDSNDHASPTVTWDGDAVAAARGDRRAGVWITDASGGNERELIAPRIDRGSDNQDLAWSGGSLYVSNGPLALVDVATRREVRLLPLGLHPAISADHKTLVYIATDANLKVGLWKADPDGRHATMLLPLSVANVILTRDGRRVFFLSSRGGRRAIWSMPVAGGPLASVVDEPVDGFDISADGQRLLFSTGGTLVTCDLDACSNRQSRRLMGIGPRWSPDGRAIVYIEGGLRVNLWTADLAGGSPRQLTHFTDRHITNFAWSEDGTQLAIARSSTTSDIVLIRGLKKLFRP